MSQGSGTASAITSGSILSSDDKTLQVVLGRLLVKEGIRVAEGHPDGRHLYVIFFETPDEFLEK